MKPIALLRLLGVLLIPVIMGCSCLENVQPDPNVVCRGDYTEFLNDLLDNGQIDYANYSCATPPPPTPTPGLYVPVADAKQPPCSMQWLSATQVPQQGPYGLSVSSQTGAVSYEFVVTYPDGTQVVLASKSSDATLMMDDLPSGAYTVEVRAVDFWGNEICSIQAGFTKAAPGFGLNAAPACEMKFVAPANGSALPVGGAVDFAWTKQPEAVSYILDFVLPNGNHGAADPTADLSKTMYMEAFQPGGTYTVFVKALNSDNFMICQASTSFTKPEAPQKLAKPPQSGSDDPVPTEQSSFLIPIIVLQPTPTPIVVK